MKFDMKRKGFLFVLIVILMWGSESSVFFKNIKKALEKAVQSAKKAQADVIKKQEDKNILGRSLILIQTLFTGVSLDFAIKILIAI